MLQDTLANFAARFKDYQTYQGYRVVAVDGSCLNLARDPSAPTFVRHAGAPEGYNQLKITALYDVLNKCYLSVLRDSAATGAGRNRRAGFPAHMVRL